MCDESLKLLHLLLTFVSEISNNKESVRSCFKQITSLLICIAYMSGENLDAKIHQCLIQASV